MLAEIIGRGGPGVAAHTVPTLLICAAILLLGMMLLFREKAATVRDLRHRIDFENLITSISTRFINVDPEKIDQAIDQALETIGRFCEVDRSYLFLLSPDRSTVSNTHEWTAPGTPREISSLQNVSADRAPWFMRQLAQGKIVYVPRVAALPPGAQYGREILAGRGVKSAVFVPMIDTGAPVGFLGLDCVRCEKAWSRDTVALLRIAGEIFENAIRRKTTEEAMHHGEREIKQTISLLRSTLESTADGILVIDKSGKIVSFNQRFVQLWGLPEEILKSRDDRRALDFVLEQLVDPDSFRSRVEELYANPTAESSDILRFKDGRVFERLSIPQWLDGVPEGRVWSFRDVTDRHRTHDQLKRRDAVLQAVGLAAKRFLTAPNWRTSIDEVLECLGGATGVSRVYIYEAYAGANGKLLNRLRFEWAAEGIRRHLGDQRFQKIEAQAGFEEWNRLLMQGEVVQRHETTSTPEQKQLMNGLNVRSMIVVPILVPGRLWGVIGFTDSVSVREWSASEIEALKTAADTLAAAIQRETVGEALQASEQRFRQLFERNLAGVYRTTLDGKILDCNDAFARIFGFHTREELLGHGAEELYFEPSHRSKFLELLREKKGLSNLEFCLKRHDGTPVWVLENVNILEPENGEQAVLEGTLIDITDRKSAEQQIAHQAYHDALTGLPNRMLFQDRLTIALAHAQRLGEHVAVLFVDLDQFKLVNDTLGHTAGDLLLQAVGDRLLDVVRSEDTVARIGGDEFTLLLSDLHIEETAAKVAQKLLNVIAEPFAIEDQQLFITASLGIALYPSDGIDAETLLKNADSAMYRAKELGRNNYQLCTPAMNKRALERLSLENAMRRGIERKEFVLYYQPQLNLATDRIVAFEALIRWQHPDRGLLLPKDFIGVAEDTRLIVPLGEWVIEEACRQIREWQIFLPTLRVAVNLSARQFQQRELIRHVQRVLALNDLDASLLDLEITESVAMQNVEITMSMLNDLREMGVGLSIDDFGTGHSSLSYLKRLPLDAVKIDQVFIRDVIRDPGTASIVSGMIWMAHALKLRVVAEGVETLEQQEFLQRQGCEDIQGYVFSRPLSSETISSWLVRSGGDATSFPRHPLAELSM